MKTGVAGKKWVDNLERASGGRKSGPEGKSMRLKKCWVHNFNSTEFRRQIHDWIYDFHYLSVVKSHKRSGPSDIIPCVYMHCKYKGGTKIKSGKPGWLCVDMFIPSTPFFTVWASPKSTSLKFFHYHSSLATTMMMSALMMRDQSLKNDVFANLSVLVSASNKQCSGLWAK